MVAARAPVAQEGRLAAATRHGPGSKLLGFFRLRSNLGEWSGPEGQDWPEALCDILPRDIGEYISMDSLSNDGRSTAACTVFRQVVLLQRVEEFFRDFAALFFFGMVPALVQSVELNK